MQEDILVSAHGMIAAYRSSVWNQEKSEKKV